MTSREALAGGLLRAGCRGAVLGLWLLAALTSRAVAADPLWPPWDFPCDALTVDFARALPDSHSRPTATVAVVAVAVIRVYQLALSKPYNAAFNPGGCSFTPSCSEYGLRAIRRHGLLRGVLMTSDRLQRCHPAAPFCGYDVDEGIGRGRLVDPPVWLQADPQAKGPVVR